MEKIFNLSWLRDAGSLNKEGFYLRLVAQLSDRRLERVQIITADAAGGYSEHVGRLCFEARCIGVRVADVVFNHNE